MVTAAACCKTNARMRLCRKSGACSKLCAVGAVVASSAAVTGISERRALVIDDEPGIRILVTRILTRYGFTVDAARDGAEGIEKILQHHYDLIALDLMMPRIDGIGVINYLVEKRPEDLPNVIVMTAFGATARPKVCPPVTRFIEKPFDIDTFLAAAGDMLRAPVTPPQPADGASAEERPPDSHHEDIPV